VFKPLSPGLLSHFVRCDEFLKVDRLDTCPQSASRTKRVAAKSIAAIPAEAIPFLGVAVLIADTGYELYAACETITDLDRLYSEMAMANETLDDVIHNVCDPK